MMRTRLTLAQLEAFLHVVDHGSFREASRALNISQPALSRTVRLAEHSVNAQLFDRNKKRISLTPAGERLVPIARRIFREFEHSMSELGDFISGGLGVVSLAVLPSIANSLLPGAIAAFSRAYPNVKFAVREGTATSILDDLRNGLVQCAITAEIASTEYLDFRPMGFDELVLVCRRDDELATQQRVSWDAFSRRPFIAIAENSSVRFATNQAFRNQQILVEPAFEVDSWPLAGQLVAQGLGLAAMPKLTVRLNSFSQLATQPLEPSVKRRLGIITVRDKTLPPATTKFLGSLIDDGPDVDLSMLQSISKLTAAPCKT